MAQPEAYELSEQGEQLVVDVAPRHPAGGHKILGAGLWYRPGGLSEEVSVT
jgi:hypothetical protein